ncbi:SGNH/GDSL hydrolase family protein [Methylobacterium sp. M6A4_1b]
MNDPGHGLPGSPDGRGMRRTVRAIGVAAGVTLAAAAPAGSTDEAQRNTQLADAHRTQRLPAIRAALSAARPGFVFLAGNSHAELIGDLLALRLPGLVNGGIGGTSARRYAAELDGLTFPVQAGVAVLFLGTNDILRRAAPLSAGTLGGFEAAAARSLERLRANADLVLVAAVPPIGPEARADRDPAAVAVYSAALRGLCARHGCRFFDPFAALRDGEAGLTRQAAAPDGVHLRDYAALAADLETRLRALGSRRPPD